VNAPERDPWSRYLEADREGRPEEAERALFEAFGALPRPAPRAGFAARVMARVAPPSWFARTWVRAALAAAAVLAAAALVLVPPIAIPIAEAVGPGGVMHLLADAFTGFVVRIGRGADLWRVLATVSDAIAAAVSRPQIALLLLAQFALAALSLHRLAALARSRRYVPHVAS
jgi:hypothetical protein